MKRAEVAQWQSNGFVNRRLWVRLPSSALSFLRRLSLSAIFCAFLPVAALAGFQPNFTAEGGVLLSSPAFHVEQISTGYRMYFSSANYFVMSATSTDGFTWGVESGVRISTQAGYYDASSITAMGMMYNPTDYPSYPYVAFYVGRDASGTYNILKATSADGLAWGKVSNFVLSYPSYVDSPRPYRYNTTNLKLYYTRDSVGSGVATDSRMYVLNSTDKGATFSMATETALLASATAFQLCVATVTATQMHMYYTAPASGETVPSQVYSLTSYNNGLAFLTDTGVRYSTSSASAAITGFTLARSTEAYRWRMYVDMQSVSVSSSSVYAALTLSPFIRSNSPTQVYQTSSSTTFTVSGEIFSDTISSIGLSNGTDTIPVASWTRDSGTQLTFVGNPFGTGTGDYTLTVTNSDGRQTTLSSAVNVDVEPGSVLVTDNLFRPRNGTSCRIDVTSYATGDTRIKVYTRTGRKVRTVYDGSSSPGTATYFWNGTNDDGATVASGLYLMVITAPKVEATEKVVVIK